jgi:hypothetical protein
LVELAREAYEAGKVVDPPRLEELAHELFQCAGLVKVYGGNADATERYARAVEETAELARLISQRVRAVA